MMTSLRITRNPSRSNFKLNFIVSAADERAEEQIIHFSVLIITSATNCYRKAIIHINCLQLSENTKYKYEKY